MNHLREVLQPLIIAARTPAALAGLALELRALAEELEARAAALIHERGRAPADRLGTGAHMQRGPGRQPAEYIRIQRFAKAPRRGDARDGGEQRAACGRLMGHWVECCPVVPLV